MIKHNVRVKKQISGRRVLANSSPYSLLEENLSQAMLESRGVGSILLLRFAEQTS
ncbi:hypothetical protein [Helicobacter sp.]|uniref:hypothetical protein n=1 Tax=Helicobacter sp. TaxID=218 RepID=UPI0025C0327B|nr:hypothetical protein [Helicobacter sp.]MBR2495303.1 hypothetical protein [Helicobacter sp.]